MPVDKDKIKNSLDSFEEGDYKDSEEELKDQIRKSVKGHLKNKLGLDGNPDGSESEEEEEPEKEEEPDNSGDPDNDDLEEE